MSHYLDAYVVCPYFKRYHPQRLSITCEGVPKSSAANMMLFENGEKCYRYLRQRCCEDYRECPIARLLYEKYEEG